MYEWTVDEYEQEEVWDVEGHGSGHRDYDPKQESTVTSRHVADTDAQTWKYKERSKLVLLRMSFGTLASASDALIKGYKST